MLFNDYKQFIGSFNCTKQYNHFMLVVYSRLLYTIFSYPGIILQCILFQFKRGLYFNRNIAGQ